MWHSHAMEYHLMIKTSEVLIYAVTWMNLENIEREKKPAIKGHLLYDSIFIKYA